MKRIFTSLLLAVVFVLTFAFSGCGAPAATLQSISVSKLPQTEYEIGAVLDLTGGELTATYSDNSTVIVAMTDSNVDVQKPNMKTVGEKTVSLTYQAKIATFKIRVSEPKLTVTYNMNYAGSTSQEQKVDNGAKTTALTAPTRAGYAFMGWYTQAEGGAKFNFDSAITADTTIYAQWGYNFTFNYNGNGTADQTSVVAVGATVNEPAAPSYEGFIFEGWYTAATDGTEYNFASAVNANTTVYAVWTRATGDVCTVTFNVNDGSGVTRTKQVAKGGTVKAIADPTIEGATFGGWYTDAEFTTAYDFATPVQGNMELFAKWNASRYSITYNYNHANNNGVYKVVGNIIPNSRSAAPEAPVLDGFYFAGWYKEAACTTEFDYNTRINSFTHLYAKWLKEWEFQAEYTDFGDREAFGYSANGTGAAAFINHNNADLVGAHSGYWVANLHNKGLYVEFVIESDAEVFDAVLVPRLSADFYDITLNKDNFELKVNGTVIDYSTVLTITGAVAPDQGGIMNKRPFSNFELVKGIHLVKGSNTIRFTINDSVKYGEVGTMNATAPMFDSLYVNTNATLTWTPITSNV